MQVRNRLLPLAAAALVLSLSGCLNASSGLDYSRPSPAPQPTPYQTAMNGTAPGQGGWPSGQLPIPGEPYGYSPSPVKPAVPPPPPPPPAPAPPPCQLPQAGQAISLEGCKQNDVLILRGVNFEFNKDRLTLNAKTILDQVADALKARPDIKVEIAGHTDGIGTVAYNLRLSDRRAKSVKRYLVEKGIAGDRMSTVGYGKSRPIADNATDEGRALNRRVELKVTEANAAAAPSPAPVYAAPAAPPAAPSSAGSAVTIAKFAFNPETLTVPVGSTVTWTNQDLDTPHIVKFSDGASPALKQGQSYSKTFSAPGIYSYQCGVHPYMTGKIVVQ